MPRILSSSYQMRWLDLISFKKIISIEAQTLKAIGFLIRSI